MPQNYLTQMAVTKDAPNQQTEIFVQLFTYLTMKVNTDVFNNVQYCKPAS